MWAVKVKLLKLNVFEPTVLIILLSAISRLTAEFRSWRKPQFCKTAICTRKALRQIGVNVSAVNVSAVNVSGVNVNAHESLRNLSSPRPDTNKTGNILQRKTRGAFVQSLLQRESNKYYTSWMYARSLRYPACNAHAPYCHPWPVSHYKIFPHYLIKGTILEKKKLLNKKRVFWFSLHFSSETFLVPRRIEGDRLKSMSVST
jgi:hypothetical protein